MKKKTKIKPKLSKPTSVTAQASTIEVTSLEEKQKSPKPKNSRDALKHSIIDHMGVRRRASIPVQETIKRLRDDIKLADDEIVRLSEEGVLLEQKLSTTKAISPSDKYHALEKKVAELMQQISNLSVIAEDNFHRASCYYQMLKVNNLIP